MTAADDGASYREADDPLVRGVRLVAVQATLLSAAVHLLWAADRAGAVGDARPYLFALSGGLLAVVAAAAFRGAHYRRLYALGAGLLAAQLLGFVYWHGLGGAVAAALADPFALVAKPAEAVGIAAFLALYRLAPPTAAVAARREGAFEESLVSDFIEEADGESDGDPDDGSGGDSER